MSDATAIFIGIGILFNFFGCIGLIRMPDVYNRLQAATKCVTLGTWSILIGLFLHFKWTATGIKSLIAIPLLFLVSTVAAHSLARGAYIFGIRLWKKSVVDDYKDVKK
ncbi:MAG: monovalent cation/H(+) antiporter subunit G [Spirochaetes bacterium]|nr:monovalent cation/H(+) antiporter subunit G [Spirochaetota bacterium]